MVPQSAVRLSEEEVRRLFGVLLAQLRTAMSLTDARVAVAAAGITGVDAPQRYWDPFLVGDEKAFCELKPEAQFAAVRVLADRLAHHESVQKLFRQHGFEYLDGTFVPVALLDEREAPYLPASSRSELGKAMKRLVDGDHTGAITAACGAVDAVMQKLYEAHALGDPGQVSFSTKVNTAAKQVRVFEDMKAELISLGMKDGDADELLNHMSKGINHAAQMLQILRRTMGDVHGSKPALRRTAYDAIKWASAICALFERGEGVAT